MADDETDPSLLSGEALTRWYRRSPSEIARERQTRESERYDAFFGPLRDVVPGISRTPEQYGAEAVQTPNVRAVADGTAFVDRGGAGSGDGGQLLEIGNPHNRRLKREHIAKYGSWPKTVAGRDYDVAHIKAIADGGTNTLDNIRPMHPDAHRAEHLANKDGARWGRRPHIARAFGGTVARAFGPLSLLSDLTGMLSGRIRTDNLDNFSSDLTGLPSREDRLNAYEDMQRGWNPNWKWGDPSII